MAPISLDQLYMIVEKQDERYAQLHNEIEKLKSWSDLNDHYLQDMVDNLCSSFDHLRIAISELHDADRINNRLEELKAEEKAPVAQLLREFIETNASPEELEALKHP